MEKLSDEIAKAVSEMVKTAPNIFLLGVAFISLGIGLWIFVKANRQTFVNPLSWSLVCWIFIALFPVFMIFSFFPSEARGEIFGFTLTGAFAGYIFIWWFGSRKYIDAVGKDELNCKVKDLEEKLENARIINKPEREKADGQPQVVYNLTKPKNKKIILAPGNVTAVKNVDIWVNSENTNMQMASYYDRSISGTIRYYGAKRKPGGSVTDDLINKALIQELIDQKLIKKIGENLTVAPGCVFVTGSGELEKSNGVKKIFHVASVQGTASYGYRPVLNIAECVRNVLNETEKFPELQSILFPILGTGQGSGDLKSTVKVLIDTTLAYFLEDREQIKINSVYFVTLFDDQLAVCKDVLELHKSQERVTKQLK